jgi:hypothetical protein
LKYIQFVATSPNLNESNEPTEEPYRICGAIKNIKSADGTRVKTLCAIYEYRTYAASEAFCVANQMKLAKIENTSVQSAVIDFTNKQYSWATAGGYVFVDAAKLYGYCSYLTNYGRGASNYALFNNGNCYSSLFHFCEF